MIYVTVLGLSTGRIGCFVAGGSLKILRIGGGVKLILQVSDRDKCPYPFERHGKKCVGILIFQDDVNLWLLDQKTRHAIKLRKADLSF